MFSLIELAALAVVVGYAWKKGYLAKVWAWLKSKTTSTPAATASMAATDSEGSKSGRPQAAADLNNGAQRPWDN